MALRSKKELILRYIITPRFSLGLFIYEINYYYLPLFIEIDIDALTYKWFNILLRYKFQ